ncbi:MAG: TPR end-of-group domain-containing protein [Blastocatellia bacterium]
MREVLSKRPKAATKTTAKAKVTGNRVQPKLAKLAKPVKPKSAAIGNKAKTVSAAKPKTAQLKPVKAAKPVNKPVAAKKVVVPKTKAMPKTTAKKTAPKAPATKKITKRIASTAKSAAKPAKSKVLSKAPAVAVKPVARAAAKPVPAKAPTRQPAKPVLPVRVVPPPPPEPPRRTGAVAALKAFEHAVRVFNRRHFEDAKHMFESLQAKFPNEVEIITRSQMYLQVCAQKLANMPSTPRNADELYDRGVYALNIGDFSQAKNFFEKALRLKPEEPHLLYSLAATHAQTGSHDQALDYLQRTIQLQPRYRAQALNDSDFSELRENKQFLELLGLASPFDILQARR